MPLWRRIAALVLLLVLPVMSALAQDVPALHARVTDLTHTLDAAQTSELEAQLAALEQRKGSQLVVLMVPSTGGRALEEYSLAVAEKNKIGRGKVDDGLLLLIAKDDRQARIEVGYGLEGAVPDVVASRVIREYLAPHFREGDYFGGIKESITILTKLIDGESLPAPMAAERNLGGSPSMLAIFIGIFIGMFAGATGLRPAVFRRVGAGGLAAGLAWLIFGAGISMLIAGFIAFLSASSGSGRFGSGRGGWGSFPGGGGGWGSGGGGWSGGGGTFGGGGASGRW